MPHQPPTPEELEAAPVISRWYAEDGALIGNVTGHPGIEEGHLVRTSPVLAIDEDAGWVRTRSRYYRLGVHGMEKLN